MVGLSEPFWQWALHNQELVGRLTQLDVSGNDKAVGGCYNRVNELLGMLERVTALRSLNISDNMLDDAHMQFFTVHVLPALTALTWLSVAANDAGHRGISFLLQSLIELRGQGVSGLKELDVSDNCVKYKKIWTVERVAEAWRRGLQSKHVVATAWAFALELEPENQAAKGMKLRVSSSPVLGNVKATGSTTSTTSPGCRISRALPGLWSGGRFMPEPCSWTRRWR